LYLRRIGRSLGEIATVICTHSHADHVGGVRGIVGGRSVDVLMHPADAAQSDATLLDVETILFAHYAPWRREPRLALRALAE
jgi:glyoxylase-like metal-dependent hydrolase (beta-lactamase superfamily II)